MTTDQAIPPPRSVLVVIPTLNEAATITGVLESLQRGLPDLPVRFVVADGGSQDGTPAMVRKLAEQGHDVHLLHNPERLQSAAVNLAVRRFGSAHDVLIRCDAHADYPPGFIASLLESLHKHQADAVVVPMDSVGDTCLRKAIAWVSDTLVGSGGSAHRGGRRSGFVDHGHHAAFRMESFVEAGGYDASFSHNEDAELDCRQRAFGRRIFLDSEIRLGYYPRPTLRGLWRQYFNYGRGRSRTMRKHPGSARLRQWAVPFHVAVSLLSLVAAPWWAWGLLWPAAYLAVLCFTALQLSVKHRSLCGLLAAPAAFTMHTSWALGLFDGWIRIKEAPWSRHGAQGLKLDVRPASVTT